MLNISTLRIFKQEPYYKVSNMQLKLVAGNSKEYVRLYFILTQPISCSANILTNQASQGVNKNYTAGTGSTGM